MYSNFELLIKQDLYLKGDEIIVEDCYSEGKNLKYRVSNDL